MQHNRSPASAWALFDGYGAPICGTTVPFDGRDGVIHSRPACHVLFDCEVGRTGNDVDLILILPLGRGPHQIPIDHLARSVSVLDSGGAVAVNGSDDAAVADVITSILDLCGGGRA